MGLVFFRISFYYCGTDECVIIEEAKEGRRRRDKKKGRSKKRLFLI
jgi:hypothetical protein